jgi:hypothetical protein
MEKKINIYNIEDLVQIGENARRAPNNNAEANYQNRTAEEIEMDKLIIAEKKLFLLVNIMNSGVMVGEGLTKDINYVIADGINRNIIEEKIMTILKTV